MLITGLLTSQTSPLWTSPSGDRPWPRWLHASPSLYAHELKNMVEGFTRHLDGDMLRRMARHVRKRAQLCTSVNGGHFEHLISKKGVVWDYKFKCPSVICVHHEFCNHIFNKSYFFYHLLLDISK